MTRAPDPGLAASFAQIQNEVAEVAHRAGRDPSGVRILAAVKHVSWSKIASLASAGQRLFGESYVQESHSRVGRLRAEYTDVHVDFIGRLQSNKAPLAIGYFEVIQTLDRPSLAEALSREAQRQGHVQDVFVQINISRESTKGGIAPEDLREFLRRVTALPNLRLCGLMSLGTVLSESNAAQVRREMREMGALCAEHRGQFDVATPDLSMGTSSDWPIAVEEGATIVRLGTSLFGEREGNRRATKAQGRVEAEGM